MKRFVLPVLIIVGLVLLSPARHSYRSWKHSRFLRQAERQFGSGNYPSAALSARKAVEISPADPAGLRLLACIAEKTGSVEALELRRQVAELQPEYGSNNLALARTALAFGKVTEAKQALQQVHAQQTNSFEFQTLAFALALELKDLDSAKSHCTLAAALAPQNTATRFNLALLNLHSEEPAIKDAGVESLSGLSQSGPRQQAALRALIHFYLGEKQNQRAQTYSEKLAMLEHATIQDKLLHLEVLQTFKSPDSLPFLQTLKNAASGNPAEISAVGSWLREHRQTPEAVRWLEQLPEKVRTEPLVAQLLSSCYGDNQDWQRAQMVLEHQSWGPLEFLRLALLSHTCRQQNQERASESLWNSAVTAASGNQNALNSLLRMARTWGWNSEEERLAWHIVNRYPQEKFLLARLNEIYTSARDTRGLQKVYSALLRYDNADYVTRNNFATLSLLAGTETNRAHQIARENYLQRPHDSTIISTYAYSLYLLGETDKGLSAFESLPQAELEKPAVAGYYGLLLSNSGSHERAKRFLQIAEKAPLLLAEEKQLLAHAAKN